MVVYYPALECSTSLLFRCCCRSAGVAMAIAVKERTRLAHETLEILLSDLPDEALDVSGPISALIKRQHPVTKLLDASHAHRLGKTLSPNTVALWQELREFRKFISRFQNQKADMYPGWDCGGDLVAE